MTKEITLNTSAGAQQTNESGDELNSFTNNTTASRNMIKSKATPDEEPAASEASILSSTSQPSQICLAPCHRFHTNPALSSPKHFLQSTARNLSPSASPARSNTHTSSLSGANNKALKRKQRLAQYKAQVTSSDHASFPPAIASSPSQSGLPTPTDIKALTSSSSNGGGDACLVKWAPNLNYIKNVELVAIASPLTSIDSYQHTGHGSKQSQHNGITSTAAVSHNNGSDVFVLVFDEGIFSHNGDFSISTELCDLFGLPTQNLDYCSNRGKKNREQDNEDNNDNTSKDKDGLKNKQTSCGLRRRVFRTNTTKVVDDCVSPSANVIQEGNIDNSINRKDDVTSTGQPTSIAPSTKPSTKMEKLESSYNTLSNDIIKPLFAHVTREVENCIQILQSEIVGDGRIHNSSPPKAFGISNEKGTAARPTANSISSVSSIDTCPKKENKSSIDESNNDVGGTAECPIKPTLVFRINLPYSTTSMEVTNLEWNADGTSLSIVQRRKGFSLSSNALLSSNITNKKKKVNTLNQPVAPGNTAVSFWCIPPWLHVDYDEMKPYDNESEDFCEDRLIIKANNTCDDCGWEVQDEDENRSLFPLWEWYLAKYVFKDESIPSDMRAGRKTKILCKNMMEQNAYAMELSLLSNSSVSAISRHGKKSTLRGNRGSNNTTENVNAMMNGDVTCLFWEDATPEDEKILGPNAYKERQGNEMDNVSCDDEGQNEHSDSKADANTKDFKTDSDAIATPSKWIAIGTSKGQIILHNSAASFLSNHTRKVKNKAQTSNNASNLLSSISTQSRTVAVPVRHKKRVTCGAWVDNLLVFGYVGTGCLTLVSTFPKAQQQTSDRNTSGASRFKQDILDPLFGEKTAKVLGNVMLPGGRDAVDIKMGNIEDDVGSITILSVNCEEKCLLFYTFPKLTENAENSCHSDITSSPAMEVNFTMNTSTKGGLPCGNIIFHYIIPNTFLAVVAFSSGYFALVDWVAGLILNDKDVSALCGDETITEAAAAATRETHGEENFLLDVAFHLPTCTGACLTTTGHIVVYHVRIRDRCDSEEDTSGENFISVSSKTHTRPKTKSSLSQNDQFIDPESATMLMTGKIDVLCARKVAGPKGYRIDFSADGESLSVSNLDESVSIFSIKADNDESNEIKERLAQKIFLFTPFQNRMLLYIAIFTLFWMYHQK